MRRAAQKKNADRCLKMASQATNPELRELLEGLAADYIAGKVKEPPHRRQDCKTFEDACRYIYKSAHLSPDYSIVVENGIVERIDWPGREFSDKQVTLLEEFVKTRGLKPTGLLELRLRTTRVTSEGVEKLRRTLPQTKITIVLRGDKIPELDLPQFRPKG